MRDKLASRPGGEENRLPWPFRKRKFFPKAPVPRLWTSCPRGMSASVLPKVFSETPSVPSSLRSGHKRTRRVEEKSFRSATYNETSEN